MRRKIKARRAINPDLAYNSTTIEKFINQIMKEGKKSVARKIMYDTMDEIKTKTKVENPLVVFDAAIKNSSPDLEVRSRRIGGANYQVPREVNPKRKLALAMRWLLEGARTKKGANMSKKLADELIAASKNEGFAAKKEKILIEWLEANKAFSAFRLVGSLCS